MTTTLYAVAAEEAALADALAASGLIGGVALLAAPTAFHVARVGTDGCLTPGGAVDLDLVYEARVFTEDSELRWLHTEEGRGRAVMLAEDLDTLPVFGTSLPALSAVETLPAHYLVWGAAEAASSGGWVSLTAARIGALAVPAPAVPKDGRVRLAAVEYVAVEPEHGNAYVAEERLLRLEPYSVEEPAGGVGSRGAEEGVR